MAKLSHSLAAAAVAVVTVAASGSVVPASADGTHGDEYSWQVRLSERAENIIDRRDIAITDVGPGRLKAWAGDVFLSFPVVAKRYVRTGDYDRDRIIVMAGGVRFRGAQAETWKRFRVHR